jgi:hypothetical protein
MYENKAKVLLIVEGERTDDKLMRHLFDIYGISDSHEIVPFRTNIYTLYKKMFIDDEPENLDVQNVLLEIQVMNMKEKFLRMIILILCLFLIWIHRILHFRVRL